MYSGGMRISCPRLSVARRSDSYRLALPFGHRPLHHLAIHVEADCFDVAVLLAAQQISGASQFQIERGDAEPRTEIAEFFQRGQDADARWR